jgi:transposase
MPAAGKSFGQVAQALEISEQTYYRWQNGDRRKALVVAASS